MSKKLSKLLSCFLAVVFVMSLTTQALALDKHRPSPEGPTSLTNANLNFYINLAGDILDVSGDSSQHASSLFTDKLTSEFTVNANLQEDVFNSSYYCLNSSQFDSIVGEDESDYENIDSEIRSILNSYISFPSDEDILSKIPHTILYNEEIYDLEEIIDDQDVCGKNISSDITLVVKYGKEGGNPTPPTKTYSVRYEWTVNGGPGLPSTVTLPKGESHDRTFVFSTNGDYYKDLEVSVTGGKYVFSGWSDGNKSMMNGTMIREPSEQIEVLVEELVLRGTWEWVEDEVVPPPSTPSKKTYYKIEVEFVDANGNEIADEYSTTVRKNHEYDVTNKIPDTIMVGDKEYTLKTTTGDPLSGTANTNKKITAWYVEGPKKDETPQYR